MKEKNSNYFRGRREYFLNYYTPLINLIFFVNFNFIVGEGDDAGEGGDN